MFKNQFHIPERTQVFAGPSEFTLGLAFTHKKFEKFFVVWKNLLQADLLPSR